MDIKALLALAALSAQKGRTELACEILKQACACPEFNEFYTSSVQQPMATVAPVEACNEMPASSGNEGTGIDGLDNFVDHVGTLPPKAPIMGGISPSENSFNPSLHGDDGVALGQVIAVASAIYSQNRFVHDGDELVVDPQLGAFASSLDIDLSAYDEDALVSRVQKTKTPVTLAPGRITIKL